LYEIGYHLRRDYWGQGLATEAAIACREWGFTNLKVDRLISLIRPENVLSCGVAERNGMTIWKEVDWRGLRHYVYAVQKAGSDLPNKLSSFASLRDSFIKTIFVPRQLPSHQVFQLE